MVGEASGPLKILSNFCDSAIVCDPLRSSVIIWKSDSMQRKNQGKKHRKYDTENKILT